MIRYIRRSALPTGWLANTACRFKDCYPDIGLVRWAFAINGAFGDSNYRSLEEIYDV